MPRHPEASPPASEPVDDEIAAAVAGAASLLVVVLDEQGRILRFNAACERATGYDAAEVVGRSVFELVPEEERSGAESVLHELKEAGQPSLHENDWLTKDGRRRRIAWSNAAIVGPDGDVRRVIGTGIDITELRTAETRRRESDSILTGIVDSAMDAIVTIDEGQRIVLFFNPAAQKMFGRTAADVIGNPLDVLLPERFRAEHHAHVERFARSGESSRRMGELGRVWGLRANGEEFPIEASISQTKTASGSVLTAILRDVSARERAMETTRLLGNIVASSEEAIVGTDDDDRILTWNPAAEQIYGYSAAAIVGEPLERLAPVEARADLGRLLARVRAGGRVGHLEGTGLHADGRRVEVSLSFSPRRDGSGSIVGASVIARDITEHRALERRLRQTEELAAIATLVTGIAHDIGTPMNVILGYTDMLAGSLTTAKDRERLGIIKSQIERVTRLIQTLLNYARPEPELPRELSVEETLDRALGLIAETARKRGVTIHRDFAKAAPIVGRAERLERAFLDLLVNACDAMQSGGGTLRVTTEAQEDGVVVRIEDSGIGIAPDALAQIFEPFYTTKPRGQGSGLGLLVARSIVLEHGGSIDAESKLGEGTCFRIHLPRALAVDELPPTS